MTEYRKIKCMSVRWLNLETVVQRLLKQHEALKSNFESEEESDQDRLARLKKRFSDPMTEVYLLFYQAILPVFTSINSVADLGGGFGGFKPPPPPQPTIMNNIIGQTDWVPAN